MQVFPGENIGFPGEIFHYFSQKKRQLIIQKNKVFFFSSLPALCNYLHYILFYREREIEHRGWNS